VSYRNIVISQAARTAARTPQWSRPLFAQDFDGIIGGDGLWGQADDEAGGGDTVGYTLKWLDTFQAGPAFSIDKGNLIAAEQLRQCDRIDGLVDGIIADPQACSHKLDFATITCTTQTDTSHCLDKRPDPVEASA
jgi:feruloyl esterase